MIDKVFHPKAFYRKFDSLLVKIGQGIDTHDVLSLVIEELVKSFGQDLGIIGGSVYKLRFGTFQLIKDPVGLPVGSMPDSIPRTDPVFSLLLKHKSYIFVAGEAPPWGPNSVAVMVGENDQFLMVFLLGEAWVMETLQFSLNTIRSALNYSRSTSRFNADMQEAYEIQKSLLPRDNPVFTGYDIAGRFVPAEQVGGDLYDFYLLDEDVLGFAIGDASGHGLPAALLARDVMTGLRMGMEKEMKISGVIKKLNRVIHRSRLSTRFVSLVYGELEHGGTLVYINAGHPLPLLIKADRSERLGTGGTILGPLEDTVFKRGFAFMDPGDVLVLFTDGIVEVSNNREEMFGLERIEKCVKSSRAETADVVIRNLFKEIMQFNRGEKLKDDATVLIIKRLAPPEA
ncbi:MAG: PP2C family protein-serine/threonine phosphatase [Candidatus Krumholzibacteriota bacterium]|nr:PP2C family protein-serine/threonine phosphatase [Candidatus Krumholzibacteriota bacterium]